MKKSFKKILSLSLVLILTFMISVTAFAATISPDQAKAIALDSLSYVSLVYNTHELTTNDEGTEVYKVSTMVEFADGTNTKYTTIVDADNGKVLNKRCKLNASLFDDFFPDSGNDGIYLSRDRALLCAYKAFCVNPSDVVVLSVNETSVGAVVISYDIAFAIGYGTKYTCTVYAETGIIDQMEIYQPEGFNILARIMLAVEVIIATIKNKIGF